MNQITISQTFNISESLVSKIKKQQRYTDDLSVALAISKLSGKKPIDHVRPNLRKLALAAHPELNVVHGARLQKKA